MQVFRLGVTNPSDYHTPASDYMTKRSRKAWLEERAFIALSLAAHRGHEELALALIANGNTLLPVFTLIFNIIQNIFSNTF